MKNLPIELLRSGDDGTSALFAQKGLNSRRKRL
jgi:hypothetical protein